MSTLITLYSEYKWLCNYTHGSPLTGYTRDALTSSDKSIKSLLSVEKLYETQISTPTHEICYLSLSLILIDLIRLKDIVLPEMQTNLILKVTAFWTDFQKFSLKTTYIWQNYISKFLGIVDLVNE